MLDTLVNIAAGSVAAALAVPTTIYSAECVAAVLLRRRSRHLADIVRPPVAIIVPAHNEESGITETLLSIRLQLRDHDRLIVVADNCDDRTAELARAAGATVVERFDPVLRGKGYALDAGMAALADAPPPVVIFIDADCVVGPSTIGRLAREAVRTGGPVQSRYLLKAPRGASLPQAVAEFAFLVKNRVRPLGMRALGLPCQLTGSGMAFPWAVISKARLANAHLVEDMKLGLELAREGTAPRFLDGATITSRFPTSDQGTRTQRQRWESGHLEMGRIAFSALSQGATYRNPRYLAMILDVIVPPLTLLGLLLVASFILLSGLALLGLSATPAILAGLNLAVLLGATGLAWLTYGRDALPARAILAVPVYALSKVGLYVRVLFGRARSGWIRTDRASNDGV